MSMEEKLAEYRARKARDYALFKDGGSLNSSPEPGSSLSTSSGGQDSRLQTLTSTNRIISTFASFFSIIVSFAVLVFTTLSRAIAFTIAPVVNSRAYQSMSSYAADMLCRFQASAPVRVVVHGIRSTRDSRLVRLVCSWLSVVQNTTLFNGLISISLILKVIVWFSCWAVFIHAEFGAVYFIVSLMMFVYFTTEKRGRGQRDTGPSAYSVFNRNCERLDGTFTAEQFEPELRFGPSSVH